MALQALTIPATSLLTTLDRVRNELGIAATDTSNDDLLYDTLRRASDAITRECGRTSAGFGVAQYQETLRGSGSQLLGLSCVPVLAVSQVLQDQEVLDPTDTTDGYSIEDREAGALYRAAGWGQTVALLAWGSDAYSSRYILPGGSNALRYTVTYWAGYLLPPQADDDILGYDPTLGVTLDTATPPTTAAIPAVLNTPAARADPPPLPGAIEQACLLTVKAWWFARQRDVSLSEVRVGQRQETYAHPLSDRALPTVALGLLRDYRRVA